MKPRVQRHRGSKANTEAQELAEKRESGKLWTALHAKLRSPNASLARGPMSSSLFPTGKNISPRGCLLLLPQKAENKTHDYVTLKYGAIWAKPVSIMHLLRVGSGRLGSEASAEVWGLVTRFPCPTRRRTRGSRLLPSHLGFPNLKSVPSLKAEMVNYFLSDFQVPSGIYLLFLILSQNNMP